MAIPSDIAGLYAWYRASTFVLSDGDVCGNWIDYGGGGRTLTVTPASGFPKYRSNVIAGYPAIEMGGSGYFINTSWGWRTNLLNHTIFVVFLTNNTTGQNPILCSQGGSVAEGFRAGPASGASAGNASGAWESTSASFVVEQAVSSGAWHYGYVALTNAAQLAISIDGATEATTALSGSRNATYPSDYCTINADGGAYWNAGYLAEAFVFSSHLGSSDKAAMNAYLRDKYFGVAPGQQEQVRDVGARRLWMRRRPGGVFEVSVPLWALDADILDRIAAEAQVGPAPGAAGWGAKKWQRRAFSLQRIICDPGAQVVKLLLLDRRPLDVLLWDSARTDERNASARQSGVARMGKTVAFVFARLSLAWIDNPADPTAVVQCAQNERAINRIGEYLEEARTNEVVRSSFASGTTGLTLAGTGTNGSAIAVDTGDLFFDTGSTPNSLKFTAGSPHAAELRATFPASASITANQVVRVSIDHKTDSGEGLYWRLQRGVDSWYWNDSGAAWQSGSVDNSMPTHADRDPADRYVSKKIDVGGSATTLTLSVFLQTGGTASRISHLYHVQIEKGTFPTSRIVTDGAAVTRVKTELSHEITTAAKQYDPALGALWCQVTPDWSSADLGSTEDQYLFWMETNGGADHDALYYDASAGAFVFERKVGGSTYTASKTATVTRGTTYSLGCRWTGVEAELDLPAYTISVFVDGVKGTDATSAAPTFTSPEVLYRGSDASFAKQINGAVRELRIFPYAPADEEIARLP